MQKLVAFLLVAAAVSSMAMAIPLEVEEKTTTGCKTIITRSAEQASDKDIKIEWTGACKGGFIEGRGTRTRHPIAGVVVKTTGGFKRGRIEGDAVVVITSPEGKRTRKGVFENGVIVRGEDLFETSAGRTRYSGLFNDVGRHGQGRTEFPDGKVHEGGYRDDFINGDGKMTMPDGMVIKGAFPKGGEMQYARIEYPNGASYEGQVKAIKSNGFVVGFKPHGRGTSLSPDRNRYSGEFRDGEAEGEGTVQRVDGRSYDVRIRDGRVERLPTQEEIAQAARAEEARYAQEMQRQVDQARYEQAVWACRSRAANSVVPVQGSFGQMLSNIAQCNLDPEAFRTPPTQVIVVPTVQAAPRGMTCSRFGVFVDCDFR